MDHLALLQGEVAALADAFGRADPALGVPSCPGWNVASLRDHVITVHDWAAQALTRQDAPPERPPTVDYRTAAAQLVAALGAHEPDAPCWTLDRDDRRTAFWRRRQLHEVAVHRWDVAHAAGRDLPLDEELAADGVDEVLTVMLPRQVRLGRTTLPDGALELTGAGTIGSGEVRSRVTAPASELLLLLWGRRPLQPDWVEGDVTHARRVLARALVP